LVDASFYHLKVLRMFNNSKKIESPLLLKSHFNQWY